LTFSFSKFSFLSESLKAICEAFIVAVEIAQLPAVPYRQNKLDKQKSKVLSSGSSGLLGPGSYLDVSNLPHMTRNVSETQLLSLKNVGTKALNNVTQQFNKLNKLGHSFNTRRPKLAVDDTEKNKVTIYLHGTQFSLSSLLYFTCLENSLLIWNLWFIIVITKAIGPHPKLGHSS
jgi:hypothetical protein